MLNKTVVMMSNNLYFFLQEAIDTSELTVKRLIKD